MPGTVASLAAEGPELVDVEDTPIHSAAWLNEEDRPAAGGLDEYGADKDDRGERRESGQGDRDIEEPLRRGREEPVSKRCRSRQGMSRRSSAPVDVGRRSMASPSDANPGAPADASRMRSLLSGFLALGGID